MSGSRIGIFAGCVLIGLAVARPATASMEIASTFSGGIHADGSTTPGFFNYYVGYSIPPTPVERRNYFIFDLDGVTTPVVSATFKLFLPGASMPSGFISSDPTEDYRISGSAFPWMAYVGAFGGTAPPPMLAAMFGTMGTGSAYGLTTISGDDSGTDIEIELSAAAIMDINASLGSKFLITGHLPDIHPSMPGMPPSELVFAYTDIPHPFIPLPRLELTFVPGPVGVAPFAVVCGVLAVRRRRVCA